MGNRPVDTHPAVFLDRDGVINRNVYYADSGEWESPRSGKDFALVPCALNAIARLRGAGYLIFIVSNQPSYAKGKTSLAALAEVHEMFEQALAGAALSVTKAYYCYHHPQGVVPGYAIACPCRKPSTYFIEMACGSYAVDMGRSWMIGDRDSDIKCGRVAGVKTVQIMSDHPTTKAGRERPDYRVSDLAEATTIILR
jgi:D-glycero-D-manno-heptose 1,7-bisphosphate phosphatase